jgi:hypothetical protein
MLLDGEGWKGFQCGDSDQWVIVVEGFAECLVRGGDEGGQDSVQSEDPISATS